MKQLSLWPFRPWRSKTAGKKTGTRKNTTQHKKVSKTPTTTKTKTKMKNERERMMKNPLKSRERE